MPEASFTDPETIRKVLASDGHSTYNVTRRSGVPISCTCPGFEYRGACKHLYMPAAEESVDTGELSD
jgi:uncharacterized Zn finger protein